MAYGPHAIARHRGFVLFVRGAVPGERVEVEVRERQRNHAFADVVAVERRSEDRRVTACPFAGTCGGCSWQHLSYPAQLRAKREVVVEQLARIAGIDTDVLPVLPSPRVYGYRHRIKMRVHGGRLGFYAGGTHELVEIAHCALAESQVDLALPEVENLVRSLASNVRRVEIVADTAGADAAMVVSAEVQGAWSSQDEGICERWLSAHPAFEGLSLRGRKWARRWGDVGITLTPEDGVSLQVGADGFSQVNPLANRILVATVLRTLGDVDGRSILEGYAGAGNFSLPLVRRGARVLAVEQSAVAKVGCIDGSEVDSSRLRAERGRVETVFNRLADTRAEFDAVLLDPPRSGAADALQAILRLKPASIVYVSCDPATLARDLKTLSSEYRVATVQPIDMFPHTYHVETVVRCDRRQP